MQVDRRRLQRPTREPATGPLAQAYLHYSQYFTQWSSGLEDIHHEAHAEVLRATTPWGRWWLQTLEGWRATDEAAGILTEARREEYDVLTAPWSDASFWFQTVVIHVCWAQRPA